MEITVKEKIELLEEGMQTLIDEVVRLNEIQEKSIQMLVDEVTRLNELVDYLMKEADR